MGVNTAANASQARPASKWAFERYYRILSYEFRVRTQMADVGRVVARLLSPFQVSESNGAPTYELVRVDEWPSFLLFRDGECIESGDAAEGSIGELLWDVNHKAVEQAQDFLALHAAAASWGEAGVVLPAPPDSGKTTLVAGLTQVGCRYLSDEVALIDVRSGLVHPFPRALWMDPGSVEVVPGLFDRLPSDFRRLMELRYYVSPEVIRPGSLGEPCRLRYVVAPSYQAGSRTALEPMTRAETVTALVENSFNFIKFGGRGLTLLSEVVRDVECYRLRIGDLESAVRTITDLVRGRDGEA